VASRGLLTTPSVKPHVIKVALALFGAVAVATPPAAGAGAAPKTFERVLLRLTWM
jgi:hypothetical protein